MTRHLRIKAALGRWDHRFLNGHPNVTRPSLRRFIMRGISAGLVVTATTNGVHAATSYHYQARAADLGLIPSEIGTPAGHARMVRFQRAEAKHPSRFLELFGPDNRAWVKNGSLFTEPEGAPLENQHDDHVHGATV